jgi:hypothetical protein
MQLDEKIKKRLINKIAGKKLVYDYKDCSCYYHYKMSSCCTFSGLLCKAQLGKYCAILEMEKQNSLNSVIDKNKEPEEEDFVLFVYHF